MRQGNPNKRLRGRNNNNNNNNNNNRKGPNPLTRTYESNGPDVKIRGTALHIAEKYVQLARDAQASGDTVMVENYYQHAEHYYRIIAAAQAQSPHQVFVREEELRDEEDEFSAAAREPRLEPRQEAPRENGRDDYRGERQDRGDRPERGERQDRGDRYERGDRQDRQDRPERGERQERYGRFGRGGMNGEGGYQRPPREPRERPVYNEEAVPGLGPQPDIGGADLRPVAAVTAPVSQPEPAPAPVAAAEPVEVAASEPVAAPAPAPRTRRSRAVEAPAPAPEPVAAEPVEASAEGAEADVPGDDDAAPRIRRRVRGSRGRGTRRNASAEGGEEPALPLGSAE